MTDGLARNFGRVSAVYDAARPSYPKPSVRWLLHGSGGAPIEGPVVDVGAGTGKLTRSIGAFGHEVVAVDPDPAMLAVLASRSPAVVTHVGQGETIPLADDSVAAVVYGQAWHWVDPAAASAEAARVLRPGGVLGLIWNIRDESVDWIRTMGEIMHASAAEALITSEHGPVIGPPFADVEHHTLRWSRPVDATGLVQLVESRSYVINAPADERRAILAGVDDLLASVPGLGEGGTIEMAYVTHSFRAVLA